MLLEHSLSTLHRASTSGVRFPLIDATLLYHPQGLSLVTSLSPDALDSGYNHRLVHVAGPVRQTPELQDSDLGLSAVGALAPSSLTLRLLTGTLLLPACTVGPACNTAAQHYDGGMVRGSSVVCWQYTSETVGWLVRGSSVARWQCAPIHKVPQCWQRLSDVLGTRILLSFTSGADVAFGDDVVFGDDVTCANKARSLNGRWRCTNGKRRSTAGRSKWAGGRSGWRKSGRTPNNGPHPQSTRIGSATTGTRIRRLPNGLFGQSGRLQAE
jgi:hypothetical protein